MPAFAQDASEEPAEATEEPTEERSAGDRCEDRAESEAEADPAGPLPRTPCGRGRRVDGVGVNLAGWPPQDSDGIP